MITYFFYTELLSVIFFFAYLIWKLGQDQLFREGCFSQEEKKIRLAWLQTFILVYIIDFIASLGLYFFGSDTRTEEVFFTILTFFPSMAMMYYFPYVKFGTRWLGAFLILSPIAILASFISTFIFSVFTTLEASYLVVTSLFSVYFLIHCKHLYDLNCKIKKENAVS